MCTALHVQQLCIAACALGVQLRAAGPGVASLRDGRLGQRVLHPYREHPHPPRKDRTVMRLPGPANKSFPIFQESVS